MEYINLDFCIIENPLDRNKKPIIFVTRKGRQYLDETIIDEDDYEKAIYAIQNIGYVESDILTFEFSQDPDFPNITIDSIKKVLEDKGMNYSEELEETMKVEFELFNLKGAKEYLKVLSGESEQKKQRMSFNSEKMFSFKKNSLFKIPEIGQKLTLYFYLFTECKFNGDKCYLNLNGDFTSNESNDLRNFIIPFKCDFIRINNVYNPNKIILKSCQTNADILKNIPMDYHGSFNLKTKDKNLIIDKVFVYYLMEVKNNFPKENRITIEIDSTINFDKMIVMSKKIKKDYDALFRLNFNSKRLIPSFEKINEILEPKMMNFADIDEFEKAGIVKKDIQYINEKIETAKQLQEVQMPYYQYIKKFRIN